MKQLTGNLIFIVAAMLAIYDVYVIMVHGPSDSISTVLQEMAHRHPIIPFVFGMLMAHWFWKE